MKGRYEHKEKARYKGALARRIPNCPGADEAFRELEDDLLALLVKHYGIGSTDPDKWRSLALSLARDHVPAFSIHTKRGLRHSKVKSDPLLELMFGPKRGRGSPRKWTEDKYAALLEYVEARKGELSDGKNVRITDKDAISKSIRFLKTLKKNTGVPYWQKRLSEARRKIPKIKN